MEDGRILIIEDEKKIADTLRLGLVENGYHADVAYEAESGEVMFEQGQYHIVLLDINLPGMNGFEFCQKIRAYNKNVVIIMLTSMSTISDKVKGYHAGADDYIVKPFEFKELLLKIRVLLKRSLEALGGLTVTLKAADLEMDLDRKEVSRSGRSINLTAKEFQLLKYLLQNKNKVVSRADIAVNVWDIDFDTNTNVIDVYINYLRNKIDKRFDQKLIQTVVGMGYILKEN